MNVAVVDLDEPHLEQTARLWERGWHDAHADLAPPDLLAHRTYDSFLARLRTKMPTARIAVSDGEVLGMCMTLDDELNQLYVSPAARGQGVAQMLMEDAEQKFRERKFKTVWLACAVGNKRAARFYEKSGWQNTGLRTVELETLSGPFPLEVWSFEKQLI